MKVVTIMVALFVVSLSIKWDQVNLSSDLRGEWNGD
jgi:hypothetical protein